MPTIDDNLSCIRTLSNRYASGDLHTSCNAEPGHEIIQDSPHSRLPLQGRPNGLYTAVEGDTHDQGDIEPIDMFVPVGFGHGCICDVRFPRVISSAPVWL